MNEFPVFQGKLPAITTRQMVNVDWLMINDYRVSLMQMMENAGSCLARLAIQRFLGKNNHQNVIVLAGSGGNGGGALVSARRLYAWGFNVKVFLAKPISKMDGTPLHQLRILERLGIPLEKGDDLSGARKNDLIIDGIIGYSLKGAPRGTAKEMIDWANAQPAPILSLDTPSGLDLTKGSIRSSVVQAAATLTLALPKKGLFSPEATTKRGELYLGDISVPPSLYDKLELKTPVPPGLFAESDIIRLDDPGSTIMA